MITLRLSTSHLLCRRLLHVRCHMSLYILHLSEFLSIQVTYALDLAQYVLLFLPEAIVNCLSHIHVLIPTCLHQVGCCWLDYLLVWCFCLVYLARGSGLLILHLLFPIPCWFLLDWQPYWLFLLFLNNCWRWLWCCNHLLFLARHIDYYWWSSTDRIQFLT